nr:hypothetical protein [Streptomyces roseirectus]
MNVVGRWVRGEWGALWLAVRRGWAVPVMTVAAVCTTSVLQAVQNLDWGYQVVQDLGAVRAADPLPLALARTPLSLFVPALDLPVWGALAQILLVFGVAELCLGWARTLAVAYAATLAGTLYARVGVALGPDVPVLGLPASDAHTVDTGPSAAVVGLAVYLAWRYRAYATGAVVVLAMLVEVAIKPNLAGKEHVAAIVAVAGVAGVGEWRRRRAEGRRRDDGAGRRDDRAGRRDDRAGRRGSGDGRPSRDPDGAAAPDDTTGSPAGRAGSRPEPVPGHFDDRFRSVPGRSDGGAHRPSAD